MGPCKTGRKKKRNYISLTPQGRNKDAVALGMKKTNTDHLKICRHYYG